MRYIDKRIYIILVLFFIINWFSLAQKGYGYSYDYDEFRWADNTPSGCPFQNDQNLDHILFTGRYQNYTNADTWYPSWASDGHLYSPWTDGYLLNLEKFEQFQDSHPGYACNSLDFLGRKGATAQARIEGNDPMNLKIFNLEPRIEANGLPRFRGRYPSANLIKDDIWYYGTYVVDAGPHCGKVGWTKLGPLVGFRYSTDFGKTWVKTELTADSSLFGEDPDVAPVKFGTPHFVDFGKNMEHSPDGKAYLVGHGSTDAGSCNSWIQGDHIYLSRVVPSIENINDESKYEYFAGRDQDGKAIWNHNFNEVKPILDWEGRLGGVCITYNPGLDKYLMCVSRGIASTKDDEGYTELRHDVMILAADEIDGEYKMVQYLDRFGPVAYFVNIPSKFISEDGTKMWLMYSANWMDKNMNGNPAGSFYSMSVHEIEIILNEEPKNLNYENNK